jgi:hypothetical protein
MANLPPTETPDISPDDLGIDAIAARLGKSVGWLNWRLSFDRGEAEPKLQHHHYIGRTPRWDEDEYQRLRQALTTRTPPKGGRQRKLRPEVAPSPDSPSSRETDTGTYRAGYALKDAASAFERVQAWPLKPVAARPPKSSGGKKKQKSATPSSGGSVLPYRSRSPSRSI